MASRFSVSCIFSDLIRSLSFVLFMYRVALFCIFCILCLLVIPVLFICVTGYSRIGLMRALYRCFLIFTDAVLNLYSFCMFILAFCVMFAMCVVEFFAKLNLYPRILTVLVVCTGVLSIWMSFMRSNSSRCCIFVAILHLLGFTDILQSFSQSSMIFSSFFSFVVACFTLFLPLPNDLVTVICKLRSDGVYVFRWRNVIYKYVKQSWTNDRSLRYTCFWYKWSSCFVIENGCNCSVYWIVSNESCKENVIVCNVVEFIEKTPVPHHVKGLLYISSGNYRFFCCRVFSSIAEVKIVMTCCVDRLCLKPNWNSLKRLWCSQYIISLLLIICSNTLHRVSINEIGQ